MTRIAFTLIGGKSWTGGYNYLLNLLHVVTQRRPGTLKPVLFFGEEIDTEEADPFAAIAGVEVVRSSRMNSSRRTVSLFNSLTRGRDTLTQQLFHENEIDVVFEAAQFYGRNLGLPAIAWIPDFQHKALPQLFSRMAWWKRELGYRAQISGGRVIMLSSDDARKQCETYYPSTVGRTHVVRFAVPSVAKPTPAEVRIVLDYYQVRSRYFFMPNQFWVHKNHLLVVEALSELRQAGHDIVVVASGKPFDPRRPDYYQFVQERIAAAGLQKNFRLLGLIPYEHLAPLMAGSLAVLNPSLFEGWSTTVEEARALNIPLVLSDLDVHKEQASGMAKFFDRHSAQSLADALLSAWQGEPMSSLIEIAKKSCYEDPVERFADDFIKLVKHSINEYHNLPRVSRQ